MQAQHKAVLKDLRRGHFDDKIDSYLGGTPGLLPRDAEETAERPSEAELARSPGTVDTPATGEPTDQVLPILEEEHSVPVVIIENPRPRAASSPPPIPTLPTSPSRQRPALPFSRGTPSQIDTTLKTEPAFEASPEFDLAPEIEIQVEVDDGDGRSALDADVQLAFDASRPTLDDHGKPPLGVVSEEARRASTISDGIPAPIRPSSPSIPPLPATDSRRLGDRQSPINASALPPARPISRPMSKPAMSPPQVVSRPVQSDDRSRRESEAVEVYSPAPPSAELPPGERPGQYAQHKKVSQRIPIEALPKERSGGVAVPAGLGPPRRTSAPPPPPAAAKPVAPLAASAAPSAVPREPTPRSANLTEPLRGRAAPTRAGSPGQAARPGSHGSSAVVMTRPAVIVGAPAKTSGTIPRIRKAREDEGRGFGQGLISEKSLDEVILAYLSEDADEK
jgi:hypothetical protein